MSYQSILAELNSFPEREKNLRSVTRYSLYHTMWYRTNLWSHSRRVAWIIEKLIPCAKKEFGEAFDANKAIALGLVHDDAETIFGDVQAGNKLNMSKEQLDEVKNQEKGAAEILIKKSPQYIGTYEYKELLSTAMDKQSLESIHVDWADKLDAFGEALHEIFAGNTLWTEHVVNEYGRILLPTEYYMNYFNNFQNKFPLSKGLFEQPNTLFKIPLSPDIEKFAKQGVPHTVQSIKQKTGYEQYDFWIQLTLENGTKEDIMNLYTKKE